MPYRFREDLAIWRTLAPGLRRLCGCLLIVQSSVEVCVLLRHQRIVEEFHAVVV